MAAPLISWTPRGLTAVTKTVDFSTLYSLAATADPFKAFKGGPETGGFTHVTRGGKVFAVNWDVSSPFQIELERLNPAASAARRRVYEQIEAWWADACAGVPFAFALHGATKSSSTTFAGVAHNASVLTGVASTTNLVAGDSVYIEDVVDPTKYTVRQIQSVNAGASTITLESEAGQTFANLSTVRHEWYFPRMVVIDRTPLCLVRRENIGFDFKIKVRTVR
jgi:hypothetical protein